MAVVMVGQGSTIFSTPVICVRYDHVMMVVHWTLHWTWIIVSIVSTRSVHIVLARPSLLRGWCRLSPLAGWKVCGTSAGWPLLSPAPVLVLASARRWLMDRDIVPGLGPS